MTATPLAALGDVVARVNDDGIRAAGVLSQVPALAYHELLVEVEATAVAE